MKILITLLLFVALMTSFFSCRNEKRTEERSTDAVEIVIDKNSKTLSDIQSTKSLGLAYMEENKLENAEKQFKKLISLSPTDASGYANLGVVYLRQGKNDEAEEMLIKAVEISPDDPDIRLNLAKVYELKNERKSSLEALKKNEEIAPDHVKTLYSIAEKYAVAKDQESVAQWEKYMQKIVESSPGNIVSRLYWAEALIQNGKSIEALNNLEEAQQINAEFPEEAQEYFLKTIAYLQQKNQKDALLSLLIFHNFIKLTPGYQKGIIELKGTQAAAVGQPIISTNSSFSNSLQEGESILDLMKFTDATSGAELDLFASEKLKTELEYISNIAIADMDGDGDLDIFYSGYSVDERNTFRYLLKSEFGRFKDITKSAGLQRPTGKDHSSRFIDFDNDGFLDIFICNSAENLLYKNISEGKFSNVTQKSKLNGHGYKSLFLDIDHEGDLDLILAKDGPNSISRNNGDGTFGNFGDASEMSNNQNSSRDLVFGDFDNDGDIDVIIANEDGPCRIFSNLRQGVFVDRTAESGIDFDKGSDNLAIADINNDGYLDILITSKTHGIKLFQNKGDGIFEISKQSEDIGKTIEGLNCYDAAFFDFDNDGLADILFAGQSSTSGEKGVFLLHNDGSRFSDASHLLPESVSNARQVAFADYNQDGDLDIFLVEMNGGLKLLRNDGGNANRHLKVQLVGLRTGSGKNNHFGIGAKIEVRAGDLYQMRMITEPGTHFGLGHRDKADVVRIIWTNGVPQNIFSPGSDQDLIETQELKGSCPFLYTWNGSEYVFVKDMMWRSALGMPLGILGGDKVYAFPNASVEYLKIPGEQLQEKNGKYSIQITEELWETIYMDEVKLIALDHPVEFEIYVDEKFIGPPYSELKVYKVKDHQIPIAAIDGKGNDLRERIKEKDFQYISNVHHEKFQGVIKMKDLILDLGDIPSTENLHLFLNGWIFPTDASINVAISQSELLKIKMPSLEVINEKGEWEEAISNIGFPSGKNKTVIVDLSNKFLTDQRKVRITTNMEIYWDYIFFAEDVDTDIKITKMVPDKADYHFRGFSKTFRKEGKNGPHWFDYYEVSTIQKWHDLTGMYTRYGDVKELLIEADDRYIIANAGDETTISFDVESLPEIQEGWTRDFLIYSVGWVKDGDLNTALGQTVEPMPYHGMTSYPYGENEHYPTTKRHLEYQKEYNTRLIDGHKFKNQLLEVP